LPSRGEGAVTKGAKTRRVRLAYRADGLNVIAAVSDHGEMQGPGLSTLVQTFLTTLTWLCPVNGSSTEGRLSLTFSGRRSLWRVTRNEGDSSTLRLIPVSGNTPAVRRGRVFGG
jgi:hypothetical protein